MGVPGESDQTGSGEPRSGARTRVSSSLTGWLWRGGMVLTAVALAFVALRAGVGVSDRAAVLGADAATHAYYTLGLFVFGGLDLGVPVGGPGWARGMLWVAYFLAPLITVSAVLETALRVLSPELLRRRRVTDHVVIVGFGRVGLLFLEALRQREPSARVIVLDRDPSNAHLAAARQLGATVFTGDVRTQGTFETLQLSRARAVAMLTDDDLVNLDVAWRAVELRPDLTVFAHVADLGMWRLVREAGEAQRRIHLFNAHRVAARRLYEEHLVPYFEATRPRDVVVIAGFGRFGQTIFEHLARRAGGEIQRAIVVDRAAHRQRRMFVDQVAEIGDAEIVCIEGDLDDPSTWGAVDEAAAGLDVEPVYVIGTDDDERNLRTAIALRRLRKAAPIFVRCVFPSAFMTRLAGELDLTTLGVEEMLRAALEERIDRWVEGRAQP